MENLLLIEVFDNKVKSVIKTKKGNRKCETLVIDSIEQSLSRINPEYLIKIYGTFDENGVVFFSGNVLMVDILDHKNKVRKKFMPMSLDELISNLTDINIESVKRTTLSIKDYEQIIFDKEVFMIILALTQQYFMFNTLELDKALKLDVITPKGIYSLFEGGNSVCIMEQVMGLSSYENIDTMNPDNTRLLWAVSLNNCISGLNLATGNYHFSLEVKNNKGEVGTIHFERSCKDFWNNIKVYKNQDDIFFGFDKGVTNL